MATLARICRKSPARTAEIPVLKETIGGDRFDRYCGVEVAVHISFRLATCGVPDAEPAPYQLLEKAGRDLRPHRIERRYFIKSHTKTDTY